MGLVEAGSALAALIENPEDTAQVFRIIEALSGKTSLRIARRMRRSPIGRQILAKRPSLLAQLNDRAYLRSLPPGSVAAAYLAFCEAEGITAEGLVEASETGTSGDAGLGGAAASATDDELFVGTRMRDAHDLWHVVTGYQGDLLGEASLLAFTYAQTRNRGVALIAATALVKLPERPMRKLIVDGFRRGRRAAWLPEIAWEEVLPRSLEDVRRELSLGHPPRYEPVRAGQTA